MPGMEWLRYETKKVTRDILHGYYDATISKCGILSMFLEYVLLRYNGLIMIRDMGDIPEQLDRLGGQSDRLKLLMNGGVLTHEQAEILWKMAQYRIRHLPHLSRSPRYFGARCFLDSVQTVHALRTLLNDRRFAVKIPEGLIPECVWGFWLG
jgi:hypothetical protein